MQNKKILPRKKNEFQFLFNPVSPANELFFLILFGCFIAYYFFLKVKLTDYIIRDIIRLALKSIISSGAVIYFLYSIAEWKNLRKMKAPFFIFGIALSLGAGYLCTKMSTNAFGVVFDLYFCIMVIGKDYRKILRNTMWIAIAMISFCALGLPFGITADIKKPYNVNPGHSIGTAYPNTWGYLFFIILLIAWYLYLRKKTVLHNILTFAIFWGSSLFIYFYVCCRTITVLTLIFPIFGLFIDLIEKKEDNKAILAYKNKLIEEEKRRKKEEEIKRTRKKGNKKNEKQIKNVITVTVKEKPDYVILTINWIVTAIPLIVLAFVLLVSYNVEWVHKHFYYTTLHNFAMRFVQGGLYFRTYGIPFIGNPYDNNDHVFVNVNGDLLNVGILDSSFSSYIIMRGILWVLLCLLWLSIANWKGLKKRDYAIPLLSFFILIFAMIERPGLELWYNFILLYPLAKSVKLDNEQLM